MSNTNNKISETVRKFTRKQQIIVAAASFGVPALILYIIFAFNGVHPFGDRQIIVTDFWHQYYPFLCEMQEKLKSGESLLYSHSIGMGINFLALMAYYCASPLNFLLGLFSKENLRDVITVFVALKVGFSGLFCSMYIKKVFSRCDISVTAFASVYALCGYVLGYYWNIMWLDSVAMLPLVMLGVHMLIKENKFVLYTVSLSLSLIFNFYIGYMICIFTAIYFFSMCIIKPVTGKEFVKKLGMIALFSAIAIMITAFITLPTYYALGNSYSAGKAFPKAKFTQSVIEILGRMASFNEPVPKEGLPNIYCSLASVALLGIYFTMKKIKIREKITAAAVMAFLILSMSLNTLNFMWHGFHTTNMVPFRYAFIFSFVVIMAAYRGFDVFRSMIEQKTYRVRNKEIADRIKYIAAVALTLFVSLCAIGKAIWPTVLGSAALGILYVVILSSFGDNKDLNSRSNFTKVFSTIVILELIANVIIAVPTVRVTTYSTYYYKGSEIEDVLEKSNANDSFGRVENAQEYILNDAALYGFNGVSTFTSTANYPVTQFMEKMAICAPRAANRYYYETTSPLTNAFLGVERVMFRSMGNLNRYLELEETSGTISLYKNVQSLPLGFMTEKDMLNAKFDSGNPFEIQNELFRKATGIDEDLFTPIELSTVGTSNMTIQGSKNGIYTFVIRDEKNKDRSFSINYIARGRNSLFAYIDSPATDKVSIGNISYKAAKRKYIFPAGNYKDGEEITFKFTLNNEELKKNKRCTFYVYEMNDNLFEDGMDLLRDEPFEIKTKTPTLIEGTVDAKKDGLFYLSVPYEKGWTLYVDGKETEITPFKNAMIAAVFSQGKHSIKLTYSPEGYNTGVVITIAGLILFAAAVLSAEGLRRFRHKKQAAAEKEGGAE